MRQAIRSSDVFLKEDVRSMLQAILVTNEALSRQVPTHDIEGYRSGFVAALAAVSTAFNINLDTTILEHEEGPRF